MERRRFHLLAVLLVALPPVALQVTSGNSSDVGLPLKPLPLLACLDDGDFAWSAYRQTLQASKEEAGHACSGSGPRTVQALRESVQVFGTTSAAEAWLSIQVDNNLFALCGDVVGVENHWAPESNDDSSTYSPKPKVCVYGVISALACLLRSYVENLPVLEHFRDPGSENIEIPISGGGGLSGEIVTPEIVTESIWRMLRVRIFEYYSSSGWPFTYMELGELVSRFRRGDSQPIDAVVKAAHERATYLRGLATAGLLPQQAGVGTRQRTQVKIRILAFSLHAPLLQEPISIWEHMSDVIQPAAEVTTMFSHFYCKMSAKPANDERSFTQCTEDTRVTELLDEYVDVRGEARETLGLKFPEILDYAALKASFRQRLGALAGSFDVLMCGEPPAFCGLFPAGPAIVGVIGTPLGAYLRPIAQCEGPDKRGCAQETFYAEFHDLASNPRNLLLVTSLYLANQVYWNAGVLPRYLRPLGLYTGVHYMPRARPSEGGEVLLSRFPYLLWDARCVLRHFAASLPASAGLRFTVMSELEDRTYASWASHSACIYFPYDPQLLTFHELYGMGMPLFLPKADMLPMWISPGYDTLQDFAHRRPGWRAPKDQVPFPWAEREDGEETSYAALRYWSELTDFAGKKDDLPGLFYFDTISELFSSLLFSDLKAASATMLARNRKDLLHTVAFWSSAFDVMGRSDSKEGVGLATARPSSPWPLEGSDALCWDPPQGFGSGPPVGTRDACCAPDAGPGCFDDHLTPERCCKATGSEVELRRNSERRKLRDSLSACTSGTCAEACAKELPTEALALCEIACRSSALIGNSLGRALHCLASRPSLGPVRAVLELFTGDGRGSTALLASSLAARAEAGPDADPTDANAFLLSFEQDAVLASEARDHLAALAEVSVELLELPESLEGASINSSSSAKQQGGGHLEQTRKSAEQQFQLYQAQLQSGRSWATSLLDSLLSPGNSTPSARAAILRGVPYPYPEGSERQDYPAGMERPSALRLLCEELVTRTGHGFDGVFLDTFQGSSLALEWPVLQASCAPRWVVVHNVNLPEHAGWVKEHLLLDPRWAEVWGGTFEDLSGIMNFAQPLAATFRFRRWSVFHRWEE